MGVWVMTIVAMFMTVPAGPIDLDDGFYLITTDTSARSVTTAGGWTVQVGEPVAVSVLEATLRSQDNFNERFQLDLEVPAAPAGPDAPPQWRLLVVNGIAHRQLGAGTGPSPDRSTMSYMCSTREDAETLAGFFQIEPRLRRHPGHRVAVRFSPPTETAQVGKPVVVTLQLKNVGREPLVFQQGGRNRAERDNQYDFIARHVGRPLVDIGTSMHFGGLSTDVTLEPGEVFEDRVDLTQWFPFDQSGVYELLGTYILALKEPGDSIFPIWEETVAAPFVVEVRE